MFNNLIFYFKDFLKKIILVLVSFLRPINKKGGVILMYHSITDNKAFFNVSLENFSKQINFLKQKNYKFIKLSDLVSLLKNNEPASYSVALTFDDGYKDIYHNVFPILKNYNIPASIFVATDFIGKKMITSDNVEIDTMDVEDIKTMETQGLVEFLPHSMSHRNMDILSFSEFIKETEGSFEALSKISGSAKKIFSYPRGRFNDNMANYLRNNHWLGAVTVVEGIVRFGDDLFKLKRLSVVSTTSFFEFRAKIYGYTEFYELIKSTLFGKYKLWKKIKK